MTNIIRRAGIRVFLAATDTASDIRRFFHRIGDKIRISQARTRWRRSAVVMAVVGGNGDPHDCSRDVTAVVNLYYRREEILSSITLMEWLSEWCGREVTVVELYFYRGGDLHQSALDLAADREIYTFTETYGDTDLGNIPAILINVKNLSPAAFATSADGATENTPLLN